MGRWADTAEVYEDDGKQEEKVIVEKNRMGLVQALTILHHLRDGLSSCEEVSEAFSVVFEWIDNMIILLNGFGGEDKNENCHDAGSA